jgi:hypothetical protein
LQFATFLSKQSLSYYRRKSRSQAQAPVQKSLSRKYVEIGKKNTMHSNSVLVVFSDLEPAEAAINALKNSGFDMKQLSVVAKDIYDEEQVVNSSRLGNRVISWSRLGVFWGWIWGLLFGSAFIFIPGIGPVMAGGPIIGWLVEAVETAAVVGGFSALGAALLSNGMIEEHVSKFETALKEKKMVVVAHGTREVIDEARSILETSSSKSPHSPESSDSLITQIPTNTLVSPVKIATLKRVKSEAS